MTFTSRVLAGLRGVREQPIAFVVGPFRAHNVRHGGDELNDAVKALLTHWQLLLEHLLKDHQLFLR